MLTIDPKDVTIQRLHRLLLGAVSPRPIAFASTIDKNGVPNLAPFSFFNAFSANPPIIVFSPARSGRTSENKDTYKNLKQVPECVINVVNFSILEQMNICAAPFPIEVNEFEKSGLTPVKSEKVSPFRIKESPVQIECKVLEIKELGEGGAAGNLVICEVVKMHINEDILNEKQEIDQHKIDLVARMGGNWLCRANEHSMFEMNRPNTTNIIGFDNLPKDIKSSSVLSGNDLGKLATFEKIPDETEVNEYKLLELSDFFVPLYDKAAQLEIELHKLAKKHLEKNEVEVAWKTLLAFNNQ